MSVIVGVLVRTKDCKENAIRFIYSYYLVWAEMQGRPIVFFGRAACMASLALSALPNNKIPCICKTYYRFSQITVRV